MHKTAWTVFKPALIAICALLIALACFVLFLLGWVRQHELADYKRFFADNQQGLTSYAEEFLAQGGIKSMSRVRSIGGVLYHVYAFTQDKNGHDASISFFVPFWEDLFWANANLAAIKSSWSSPDQTLGSFLAENNIGEKDFLKWRAFLAKYDFVTIRHEHGEEGRMADISKTSWSGLLYRKDTSLPFYYAPSLRHELTESWCYYNERGIAYPRD